jgi:uncharacterized Rossmann fold enzyme
MDSKLKEQLDFYYEFKEWYFQIINDFQFNYKKDCEARNYLSNIFHRKPKEWELEEVLKLFRERISSKRFISIYGCGPSLEKTLTDILKIRGLKFFEKFINLAADGAAVLLKEKNIKVDALITDLDGITKEEFHYADFVIVHAHGDNIENLKNFKHDIIKFKNIIGTTQVDPDVNLINPGGFTDGDRILYILRTLLNPEQKLYLFGMDFGEIVGKYSKLNLNKDGNASQEKILKLNYAIKLMNWLKERIKNEILFVNSNYITQNKMNLSIDEFLKINEN